MNKYEMFTLLIAKRLYLKTIIHLYKLNLHSKCTGCHYDDKDGFVSQTDFLYFSVKR